MLSLKVHALKSIKYRSKDVNDLYFNGLTQPFKILKLSQKSLWKTILKKRCNIAKYTYNTWYKFLETSKNIVFDKLTPIQKYIFFYYYIYLVPRNISKKKQELFHINLWCTLLSYKGWRHLFGKPVNGQRTWSNGKTRKKQKNKLYNFRLFKFQKRFGIHTKANLKISFISEHLNLLWNSEWNDEWLSANKVFSESKQKTKFFRIRINYRYMMNFQISTPKSLEYKKTKKNRKKVKTEFTVGFDCIYVISLFSKKKHLYKHLL